MYFIYNMGSFGYYMACFSIFFLYSSYALIYYTVFVLLVIIIKIIREIECIWVIMYKSITSIFVSYRAVNQDRVWIFQPDSDTRFSWAFILHFISGLLYFIINQRCVCLGFCKVQYLILILHLESVFLSSRFFLLK